MNWLKTALAFVSPWAASAWSAVSAVPVRYYVAVGLFVLGFFAGCSCARGAEGNPPHIQASCRVTSDTASGSGTCVVVDHLKCGLVLTCAHGWPVGAQVQVTFPGKEAVSGVVVAADLAADVAVVAFAKPGVNVPSARLAAAVPSDGEMVCKVGYPGGNGPKLGYGAYRPLTGWQPPRFNTNCTVAGGDSGGGVFHNGELVGVVVAYDTGDPKQIGRAVPLGVVRRFLSAVRLESSAPPVTRTPPVGLSPGACQPGR